MNAVANDYSHGTSVGRGFETEFNGARVHVIAWDNGEFERLRAVSGFTDHLVITTPAKASPELESELGVELRPSQGLPWNGSEEAIAEAIKPFAESAEFYRGIVTQIGELLGPEAKTSDDGSVQLDVLALKVPVLVQKLLEKQTPDVANIVDSAPSIPSATAETPPTDEPVPDWAPTPGAVNRCLAPNERPHDRKVMASLKGQSETIAAVSVT